MKNKNTLLFSYKTQKSFASLIQDEELKNTITLPKLKDQHYDEHFPRQAIRIAMGLEADPDQILFLGKPMLYMEKLIELHAFFFPFEPRQFYHAFLDLLSNAFQIDQMSQKAILGRTIKRCRQTPKGQEVQKEIPFHYISLSDALASEEHKTTQKFNKIAVCLTDDYNGPAFNYYQVEAGKIQQKFEEETQVGLGHFCQLFQSFKNETGLESLVKLDKFSKLVFNKSALKPVGLYLQAKTTQFPEVTKNNSEVFTEYFSKQLTQLFANEQVLLIHDFEIPKQVKDLLPNITFKFTSLDEKVTAAFHFQKYSSETF